MMILANVTFNGSTQTFLLEAPHARVIDLLRATYMWNHPPHQDTVLQDTVFQDTVLQDGQIWDKLVQIYNLHVYVEGVRILRHIDPEGMVTHGTTLVLEPWS